MFYPAGVYSAMLTAFSADGSLNEEVNRQLVEMQIEGGLDGIFPVSSSGESVAMDFASRCRLMDIVKDQARGRVAVLPGIPGCAPQEAMALGKHARECGCDGVVLIPIFITLRRIPWLPTSCRSYARKNWEDCPSSCTTSPCSRLRSRMM